MIEPLVSINSRAAVLPDANIDTDIIFPARFLLLIDREGMDKCLFADRRFAPDGSEIADFPLNRPDLRDVKVILTGPGFGCGSSREQAVWALVDYGIRVVIGTDFGDIFSGNALKNGLLLLRLEPEAHAALVQRAEVGEQFAVDLDTLELTVGGEVVHRFSLPEAVRQAYMNGWDEMDMILNAELAHVAAFEKEHRLRQPWLFRTRPQGEDS